MELIAALFAFITIILTTLFAANPLALAWGTLRNNPQQAEQVQNATRTLIDSIKEELDLGKKPKRTKSEPPDPYKGDPGLIGSWLRRMEVYFDKEEITNKWDMITYALQRITGGKAERAQNWADSKLQEWLEFKTELNGRRQEFGNHSTYDEWEHGRIVTPATANTPEIRTDPLGHLPPFKDWENFKAEAREFFMTTETRNDAIIRIKELSQRRRPVEDYIVEFRSWAPLTEYNDIALIDIFKHGLDQALGRRIIELGGVREEDIDWWYKRATELDRQYRQAQKEFGAKERFAPKQTQKPAQGTTAPKEQTPALATGNAQGQPDPNAMDVDRMRREGRCFRCGQKGHIGRNCPTNPRPKYVTRNVEMQDETAATTAKIEELKQGFQ